MRVVGTRGFTGKKTMNSHTAFNSMFSTVEDKYDIDDPKLNIRALEDLEQNE